MGGIAGILYPRQGGAECIGRLSRMQSALAPRGPDDQGMHIGREAALGHVRAARLPFEGQQPVTDTEGRWTALLDGALTNREALTQRLGARHWLRTGSDAELLLAAWHHWGQRCLEKLEGSFALLLWDSRAGVALAATDRLGTRPLVYGRQGQEVLVASQASAVLAQGWSARLEPEALVDYLVAPHWSGLRRSMFAGLRHLPAGHMLRIDRHTMREAPWITPAAPASAPHDPESLAARLGLSLEAAAEVAAGQGQALGVMLDEGMGAAVLLGLIQGRSPDAPLAFGAVSPEGRGVGTEDPWADALTGHFGLGLEPVALDPAQGIGALVQHNERLPTDEGALRRDALLRAIAAHPGMEAVSAVGSAEAHLEDTTALVAASHGLRTLLESQGVAARLACLHHRLRARDADLQRVLDDIALHARAHQIDLDGPRAVAWLVGELPLERRAHDAHALACGHGVNLHAPMLDPRALEVTCAGTVDQRTAQTLLRTAARRWLPPRLPLPDWSAALPDDRWCQRQLQRQLRDEADFVNEWLDLRALEQLTQAPTITSRQRALIFNLMAVLAWQRRWLR